MKKAALAVALLFAFVRCDREVNRVIRTPGGTGVYAVESAPVVRTIAGLDGPESALYDPEQDVYFISNIRGGLLDVDNNGFITRVEAGGSRVDPTWVAGGLRGVTLHGPKGMAILGDSLYVADVDAVRKFNRRTSQPEGEIALPGATLINDVATDGKSIFVSDTAVIPAPGVRFRPTGTDAIWILEHDRARKLASGTWLHQPNGLAFIDGKLTVASFAGREVFEPNDGHRRHARALPQGQLDGLLQLPNGDVLVTSWLGMNVYRVRGTTASLVLAGIPTPADIGFDTKRSLLLVPRSSNNEVTLHRLAGTR